MVVAPKLAARIHQIYIRILGRAAQAHRGGLQCPLRGFLGRKTTRPSAQQLVEPLMSRQGDPLPLALLEMMMPR